MAPSNNSNALAPLFKQIASRLGGHHSEVAQQTSNELSRSTHLPIVKPPQTVPQCDALDIALQAPHDPIADEINNVRKHLHWSDSSGGIKSEDVRELLAFVELLGPTGMVLNSNCRAGLLLQMANTHYPDHRHAAEELYLALSGTGTWFRDAAPAGLLQPPGDFIFHKSYESHAMVSTAMPLLAFWCWAGELSFDTYEML